MAKPLLWRHLIVAHKRREAIIEDFLQVGTFSRQDGDRWRMSAVS
jgi:hypothetical protein